MDREIEAETESNLPDITQHSDLLIPGNTDALGNLAIWRWNFSAKCHRRSGSHRCPQPWPGCVTNCKHYQTKGLLSRDLKVRVLLQVPRGRGRDVLFWHQSWSIKLLLPVCDTRILVPHAEQLNTHCSGPPQHLGLCPRALADRRRMHRNATEWTIWEQLSTTEVGEQVEKCPSFLSPQMEGHWHVTYGSPGGPHPWGPQKDEPHVHGRTLFLAHAVAAAFPSPSHSPQPCL